MVDRSVGCDDPADLGRESLLEREGQALRKSARKAGLNRLPRTRSGGRRRTPSLAPSDLIALLVLRIEYRGRIRSQSNLTCSPVLQLTADECLAQRLVGPVKKLLQLGFGKPICQNNDVRI